MDTSPNPATDTSLSQAGLAILLALLALLACVCLALWLYHADRQQRFAHQSARPRLAALETELAAQARALQTLSKEQAALQRPAGHPDEALTLAQAHQVIQTININVSLGAQPQYIAPWLTLLQSLFRPLPNKLHKALDPVLAEVMKQNQAAIATYHTTQTAWLALWHALDTLPNPANQVFHPPQLTSAQSNSQSISNTPRWQQALDHLRHFIVITRHPHSTAPMSTAHFEALKTSWVVMAHRAHWAEQHGDYAAAAQIRNSLLDQLNRHYPNMAIKKTIRDTLAKTLPTPTPITASLHQLDQQVIRLSATHPANTQAASILPTTTKESAA
jgi:hypothetical protein